MLSKPQESNSPESRQNVRQEDLAILAERLASREAACAELSSTQVKLATVVEAQSATIVGLKDELATTRAAAEERHAEIAKVTRWLADEEARTRAMQQELENARSELARISRERATAQQLAARESTAAKRRIVLLEHSEASARDICRMLGDSLELQRRHGEACVAEIRRLRDGRALRFLSRLGVALPGIPGLPATEDPRSLEERDAAIVRDSGLFDAAWYLAQHPKVAREAQDPILHYLREGAAAGFDPSIDFDTVAYLARYRDVRRSGMNPLVHYVAFGRAEGRSMSRVGTDAG